MFKRRILCASALIITSVAHAEISNGPNVTISGLLDIGVSYVNNQGGSSVTRVQDGSYLPSKITFRGDEDMGNGNHAIFDLSSKFLMDTGSLVPGKPMFDSNAYVGVSNRNVGAFTFGHQNDFSFDYISIGGNDPARDVGGLINMRQGPFAVTSGSPNLGIPTTAALAAVNSPIPGNATGAFNWDRTSGVRMPNAVKFSSVPLNGFAFGAMYSLGEATGNFGKNSGRSLGVRYDNGPHGLAAVYTEQKYPTLRNGDGAIRNFLFGGHYLLGNWNLVAMYSDARNTATDAFVYALQAAATYRFNPSWSLGGSFARIIGNKQLSNNSANQAALELNYYFSKRTTWYTSLVTQRANEGARAMLMSTGAYPGGASTTNSQTIVTSGITHRF